MLHEVTASSQSGQTRLPPKVQGHPPGQSAGEIQIREDEITAWSIAGPLHPMLYHEHVIKMATQCTRSHIAYKGLVSGTRSHTKASLPLQSPQASPVYDGPLASQHIPPSAPTEEVWQRGGVGTLLLPWQHL